MGEQIMGSVADKLEATLDGVFNKKAPVKLPPEARKSLAHAMWWVALIFGVLQLWAAYTLWSWGHRVNQVLDTLNSYSSYFGTTTAQTHLGLFYYVSLVTMAIVGALLLLAAPQLKNMSKKGWNLLFYGILLEAAVAVFRLFSSVGGGFGDFLGAAIGAVLGGFLLFQVREHFVAAKAGHKPAAPAVDKPAADKK